MNCSCSTSYRVEKMAKKTSLKQKFLKKWIKGLQIYSSSKNSTTITERKNFIKLSADIAMASARDGATKWSRALIISASQNSESKPLVERISGCSTDFLRMSAPNEGRVCRLPASITKKLTSKKILKRSRRRKRKCEPPQNRMPTSSIAKTLVKKRTRLLKNLVPGGESMDYPSLIRETLDYMMSLRAQVDVMQSLVCISEHLNRK